MPFASEGDARWQRFADGLTNDIISDLSNSRELIVMARNATEPYRGKSKSPGEVGRELNVEYVLEGSLQADDRKVRITAQLASSSDGSVVWAERFEGDSSHLFDIQDEITGKIASTLTGWQGSLKQNEEEKALRKNPVNLDAYDLYLLGGLEQSKMSKEGSALARQYYDKALAIDPNFQPVIRDYALTYAIEIDAGVADDLEQAKAAVLEYSKRAVALEPGDPIAQLNLSFGYMYYGDFVRALGPFQEAVARGSNNVDVLIMAAGTAFILGKPELGPELAARAIRLDPHYAYWWNFMLRLAYFYGHDFENALIPTNRIESDAPNDLAYTAMISAQAGRTEEAKATSAKLLSASPDWSAELLIATIGGVSRDTEAALVLDSARMAGLPSCMTKKQLGLDPAAKRLKQCDRERQAGVEVKPSE